MTREETKKILAVLKGAYPSFYRGLPADELRGILSLWETMFKDEPYALVEAATMSMIASRTNGFPPNIGEMKAEIAKILAPDEMTEAEAWNRVYLAVSRSTYGAQEEFDTLPPTLQRLVGSPNQLREWAMMDTQTLQSVTASNFMRSYRARTESERWMRVIPSRVQEAISAAADGMKMPELPDGETV